MPQDSKAVDITQQSVPVGLVAFVGRLEKLAMERLPKGSRGYEAVDSMESKDVDLFL